MLELKPPLLPFPDAELDALGANVIGAKVMGAATVVELADPVELLTYVKIEGVK